MHGLIKKFTNFTIIKLKIAKTKNSKYHFLLTLLQKDGDYRETTVTHKRQDSTVVILFADFNNPHASGSESENESNFNLFSSFIFAIFW